MAQTNKQTDGHGDSMTDPAQRAESVKIGPVLYLQELPSFIYFVFNTVEKIFHAHLRRNQLHWMAATHGCK